MDISRNRRPSYNAKPESCIKTLKVEAVYLAEGLGQTGISTTTRSRRFGGELAREIFAEAGDGRRRDASGGLESRPGGSGPISEGEGFRNHRNAVRRCAGIGVRVAPDSIPHASSFPN
jgi:hypothetical protein